MRQTNTLTSKLVFFKTLSLHQELFMLREMKGVYCKGSLLKQSESMYKNLTQWNNSNELELVINFKENNGDF